MYLRDSVQSTSHDLKESVGDVGVSLSLQQPCSEFKFSDLNDEFGVKLIKDSIIPGITDLLPDGHHDSVRTVALHRDEPGLEEET